MKKYLFLLGALAAIPACGKSVELGEVGSFTFTDPPLACGAEQTVRWNFEQPQPVYNRSVDLLFVVDSSASLNEERKRLATDLPAFVQALAPEMDYRIAVMLAHGPSSPHSGRLYSPAGVPKVLSSKSLSASQIQSYLSRTLGQSVADVDQANGEMMMDSLMRSLESGRYAELQAQGFYREGAALSIVFVTDENDICYPPELLGYTGFPHYVRSYRNSERVAYDAYCTARTTAALACGCDSLGSGDACPEERRLDRTWDPRARAARARQRPDGPSARGLPARSCPAGQRGLLATDPRNGIRAEWRSEDPARNGARGRRWQTSSSSGATRPRRRGRSQSRDPRYGRGAGGLPDRCRGLPALSFGPGNQIVRQVRVLTSWFIS